MVGVFINTLPLRLTIDERSPVHQWLTGLQAQIAEHMRYAHTPLATIRSCSAVSASEPLFHSIVVTENYPSGALQSLTLGPDVAVRDTRVVERTNFPLALMVEIEDRITLSLVYDASIVSSETAGALLEQMASVLGQIAGGQSQTVGDLDILPASERRWIEDWNHASLTPVNQDSIAQRFERQVEAQPGAVAIIAGSQSWTRIELEILANRLARALQARGVGAEQVVAAILPRSPELVVALLAIVKAGGVFLAIDPEMAEQRRDQILRDACPRVALVMPSATAGSDSCLTVTMDSSSIAQFETTPPDVVAHPDAAAYLVYTSGSTGSPKGVAGLHRGLMNRLQWIEEAFPYAQDEVCCHHISSAFVDMVAEIFSPLVAGVPLAIVERAGSITSQLQKHRVSRLTLTPSLLSVLLEQDHLADYLPALKLIISSGEVLTSSLVRQFFARLPGRQLLNVYGSSEVSADATVQCILPNHEAPPAIGRPIANVRAYIVDDSLRLIPAGTVGRLFVGGEGLARGYWNRPDWTAERFVPDPFSNYPGSRIYDTGDLARLRRDGVVEYAGRRDSEVKIRGQRVALEEVEAALAALPEVREAAVVARTDASGEKQLEAFLTPNRSAAGKTTLDFGLFYFSDSVAGAAGDYQGLLEGAKFADQNGFAAVWVPERHFTTVGGAFPNPSVVLAALAGITERVSLRAGSVVLPLHHPARVAEEWAVLDCLSHGRVAAAFTSGWLPNDFVFAPDRFASRRATMLEHVQTVRSLWRGEGVRHINGLGAEVEIRTLPRPIQPELPVWLTCTGDPELFQRAGELGLNVLTGLLSQTVDQAAEKIALYRRARARAGFDPEAGRVTMMIHTFLAPEREEALDLVRAPMLEYVRAQSHLLEDAVAHLGLVGKDEAAAVRGDVAEFALERYCRTASLIGSPESCLPMLQRLREIGVNELACLVDFVPAALMLPHLGYLDELRRLAASLPAFSAQQMRDKLRDRLPEAMIPARIAWLDRLPLSDSGKLQRDALPEILALPASRDQLEHIPPRSSLEQRVCAIWADVFGLPVVGVTDDFFAIGGHSLLAIRIVSRIRQTFGIDFPVQALFTDRDVRRLSVRIGEMMLAAHGAVEPLLPPSPSSAAIPRHDSPVAEAPLSIAQEQIWMGARSRPSSAYNESTLLRIRGPLDPLALEYALTVIVQRHDSLRVRVQLRDSVPVQEFMPELKMQLPVEDFREGPLDRRLAQARRRASEEAQRGFDVANGPLFRAALWRLDEKEYLFLITLHLLVADGWSWRVLFNDLETVYRARVEGAAASLAPLPIAYRDFALWQRARAERGELRSHLDFWKRQLESWHGRSPMPQGAVGEVAPGAFGSAEKPVPSVVMRNLATNAAGAGTTLFAALLAAFGVVLYRSSGEQDLMVASPFAGRLRPETEALVGCFVNTVLLRFQIDPEDTFRRLITRVADVVASAQPHQEAPFDEVLRILPAPGATPPRVNVLFAVTPGAPREFAGLTLRRESLAQETGKFDVVLRVDEIANEIGSEWLARLVYNQSVLSDESAAQLLHVFESAVATASRYPDATIRSVLAEPAEHKAPGIVIAPEEADDDCLTCFERQARETPGADAVVYRGHRLTYAELDARAGRIAGSLRSRALGRQSIVGLLLHRTPDLVAAIFGCWKAGAAFVAVDPATPPARVAATLQQASAVILDSDLAPRLSDTPIARISIAEAREWNEPLARRERVHRGLAAYLIFTSGSSGEPKGIVVEHGQIAAYTRSMRRLLGMNSQWHCGLLSSVAADLGYTMLFPALATGAALHLMPEEACLDQAEFARYLLQHPLTCIKILPSHLAALTRLPDDPVVLPSIVVFGGETLDGDWLQTLRRRAPECRFFNHYGPAETTVGALAWEVPATHGPNRIPLGRPLDHAQVVVVGPDSLPVPPGTPGQIAIAGAARGRPVRDHQLVGSRRRVAAVADSGVVPFDDDAEIAA